MGVVCLDTDILAYVLLADVYHYSSELTHPANQLIQNLRENQSQIMLPTIVIGELLVSLPDEKYHEVLMSLQTGWQIVEYNLKAASIFAKIRDAWNTQHRISTTRTRAELKADLMIIATALAHGADCIYSHNKDFRLMAMDFIEVHNLDEQTT